MRRRCCCGGCVTLYRVNDDYEIVWTRDFHATSHNAVTNFGLGVVHGSAVDADGNIYQVGLPTSIPKTSPPYPQTDLMHTLQSWDEDGTIRWKWSECPDGLLDGTYGHGPTELLNVACGIDGADPIVIVGDNPDRNSASVSTFRGSDTDGLVNATCLSADDAAVLWRVKLEAGMRLVGIGENRSLWKREYVVTSGTKSTSGGWITLDNATGDVVLNKPWSYVTVVGLTTLRGKVIACAIDSDDTIYAVLSRDTSSTNIDQHHYGVARFNPDEIQAEATEQSESFFKYSNSNSGAECGKLLDVPTGITITPSYLIVNSESGWEWWDKSTLTPLGHVCLWRIASLFFGTDELLGVNPFWNIYNPLAIHHVDGEQIKVWDGVEDFDDLPHPFVRTQFRSAQPHPSGGFVFGQNRTCDEHVITDDERELDFDCPDLCCSNCFEADYPSSQTSNGTTFVFNDEMNSLNNLHSAGLCKENSCTWKSLQYSTGTSQGSFLRLVQDSTGSGAALTARLATGFGSDLANGFYRCEDFDCSGGVFEKTSETHSGFPDTITLVPLDCASDAGTGDSPCLGGQDWVSVATGGVFEWRPAGAPSCSIDCDPETPVTTPTAAGQYTFTGCV